jgi:hypothetical protein
MFGKILPTHNLLIALGITIIVSVVEGGIQILYFIYGFQWNRLYRHDCRELMNPMATLLNANGDVVSAMLITNFGREKNGLRIH